MTYKEVIYDILERLKGLSDDFSFTEEHIMFIASKVRAYVLVKNYKDIRKNINNANYQTLCLSLEKHQVYDGACSNVYLRSKDEIPNVMKEFDWDIIPTDYFDSPLIISITKERMRFVGNNKYLNNIIYASIGPDNHLYFKCNNPQHYYFKNVMFRAIFDDIEKASDLECNNDKAVATCDVMDAKFPLEPSLVVLMQDTILKVFTGSLYRPEDDNNNASDTLAQLADYIRSNMKKNSEPTQNTVPTE